VYKNEETLLCEENGQPVTSLQMIPYQLKIDDSVAWGGYLSGVMTHPDYRKKGYMAQLMHASFDEMIKKKYDYTFLIPEEKWLVKVYEKFGFILCKRNSQPPKNKVLKSPKQFDIIKRNYFDDYGVWLKDEIQDPKERKGMIKRLNPNAKEINTLYMGMMLD
jgi:GNAT superfamily N-acetyltransferase